MTGITFYLRAYIWKVNPKNFKASWITPPEEL